MAEETMQLPRVCVVTPVYNGEQHLVECIESVLAQTYPNFEYLIVNNCSTDRTLEIAQEFASRDPRIRVQSNLELLNVVDSHNKGFSLASGDNDYIKVVGADDWLFPNCLTELVRVAEEHPTVGMVTSYVLVGSRIGWDGLRFPSTFVEGRDICRLRLLDRILVFGGPSASLLRTSVVKNQQPFYTVGNYHGDNEAYLRLLQHHDFGFVHQVLSYNRRGEDSRTTHYLQSFNSNILMVLEEIVRFGPVYLTEPEMNRRLGEATDLYYKFLARAAFEFRDRRFWDTHRARLKTLGQPLNHRLLVRKVVARFFDILLNPKRTIENVVERFRDLRASGRTHDGSA
jgi:glycosyltransferase involved in cell wall biosynthesis